MHAFVTVESTIIFFTQIYTTLQSITNSISDMRVLLIMKIKLKYKK